MHESKVFLDDDISVDSDAETSGEQVSELVDFTVDLLIVLIDHRTF